MSDAETTLVDAAARLREEFDRSFARAIESTTSDVVDLITLHVAGDVLAIRLRDIAGLHAGIKITPCPSPVVEFRGIAGMRADLIPVYDLSQLLGGNRSSGRWIVVAAGRAVAFAFDDFQAHFRIPADGIAGSDNPQRRHIHGIARSDRDAWPVIDLPSLVAAIRARVATLTSRKEH